MTLDLYKATRAAQHSLGHAWFTKPHDLNLVAYRGPSTTADSYDDALAIFWVDESGAERLRIWPCTTDPGRPSLASPMRSTGSAILIPAQHTASHKVGIHKGRPALVATRLLPVWRDGDRDGELDPIIQWRSGARPKVYQDGAGINIHDGGASPRVGDWSHGCVVVPGRFGAPASLIEAVERQERAGRGSTVSLTVLDWSQFPELVEAAIAAASGFDAPTSGR